MHFSIRHETEYRFSAPVFLEPHRVRLYPRGDAANIPHSRLLNVDPEPTTRSCVFDAQGNLVEQLWFAGLHGHLRITSEVEVATARVNPFDYLPLERAGGVPIRYHSAEREALSACLSAPRQPTVREYADRFLAQVSPDAGVAQLLSQLNARLSDEHRTVVRPEGAPYEPEVSLATRDLSCRDLAVLFVALCRVLGIAARFVSGYQAGDPDQDRRDLHAWSEVYIPGGGWRGYDPTLGLAVADEHVAVAAAARPEDAAPVSGSFRGTGVLGEITSQIQLVALRPPPGPPYRPPSQ